MFTRIQTTDNVTYELLPSLISMLNQNQETNALVPLNIKTGPEQDPRYSSYEGLSLKSFRGHRIAMMGDSTLMYLTKHLKAMLLIDDQDNSTKTIEYDKMRLGPADNFVKVRGRQYVYAMAPVNTLYQNLGDGTSMRWMGLSGFSLTGDSENIINSMFQQAEDLKPDIVVANMGFHWIHLCGHVDKFCPKGQGGVVIQRWLNYREHWLQRIYDWAVKMNVKVLLFKTVNFICGDARTGDWATGDAAYRSFEEGTIQNCTQSLEPLSRPFDINDKDIDNYCRNGQYTEVGATYLNNIIFDFVKNVHKNGEGVNLTVGLYNDHDVQNCNTTGDGIHHRANLLLRGRLLANAIDSYLNCGTDWSL